jgi:hypothetical protein
MAHLDAKRQNLPYVSYFIVDESLFNEDGSCREFWSAEAFEERLNKLKRRK